MLREAVASVVAQTYRDFEVIIVDDESSDETPRVIEELCQSDPRIRSLRRTNGGPGLARESGRQVAKGEFLQYLDSDDLLLPRKFELQVAALRAAPSAGIAYGITRYRDALGREIPCSWKSANRIERTLFPSLLLARWWETASPLFRRSVTDAIGPWTSLRLEEDWEYDSRAAALGTILVYVDEVVAEHRDHSDARLSRGAARDPSRLRDRATAHKLILHHARRAGVGNNAPEMQTYARELFLLARQCGATGLVDESRRLVAESRSISSSLDLRVYERMAQVFGWKAVGKLATFSDSVRW